jgi:hypothetical protein
MSPVLDVSIRGDHNPSPPEPGFARREANYALLPISARAAFSLEDKAAAVRPPPLSGERRSF